MAITKHHALLLEKLARHELENSLEATKTDGDDAVARELEIMGLAGRRAHGAYCLTPEGHKFLQVLNELVEFASHSPSHTKERLEQGTGSLPPPAQWDDSFRLVSTEVLAMLESARRARRVGDHSEEPLLARGFAKRVRDRRNRKEYVTLTHHGREILEIYERAQTRFEVTHLGLASTIRTLPLGPMPASEVTLSSRERRLLEDMRLVAYSVPHAGIFSFTGFGQAVKMLIELGAITETEECNENIFVQLINHQLATSSNVRPATTQDSLESHDVFHPISAWAREAYHILRHGARKDVWTVALHANDVVALRAIKTLWDKSVLDRGGLPTIENLHRTIRCTFRNAREPEVQREQQDNCHHNHRQQTGLGGDETQNGEKRDALGFDLREVLDSLESFHLIKSVADAAGREVFVLTNDGNYVFLDGAAQVSSTSVKCISMTRKAFSSPNRSWYNKAVEEGLIGHGSPTGRGYLYAGLAERIRRRPCLSQNEQIVFRKLGERGVLTKEICAECTGAMDIEHMKWALEKLEARHLIEILPDGNIIKTEAGKLLGRAFALARKKMKCPPITPRVVRALEAIATTAATLDPNSWCVCLSGRWIDKAQQLSGMAPEAFQSAVEAARAAGYLGRNSINEAGLLILQAAELMNPVQRLSWPTWPWGRTCALPSRETRHDKRPD